MPIAATVGVVFGDTEASLSSKNKEEILVQDSSAQPCVTESIKRKKKPSDDPRLPATLKKMGLRLKKARKARGWSQPQLAERAKVSFRTIQRIEAAGGAVAATQVIWIAEALKVDAGWLLGQDKKKKKSVARKTEL